MSALWTPGRAGVSPGFLVEPDASVTGSPSPTLSEFLWLPCEGPEAMTRRRLRPEPRLRPAYCTRVGIHWPMVVRTARRAHLRGVPPTLLQQHPTLVQCAQTTPAANGVTGAAPLRQAEAQLSHLADAPKR